jgi:subtilisin family serine protease
MRKPLLVSLVLLSLAGSAFANDSYIVLFKNDGIPADFAATVAALNGTVLRTHASGIATVSLSEENAAALAQDNAIADVQRNEAISLDNAVDAGSITEPALASYYPRQWHLRVIGADQAWAAGRFGSADVTVAVLDSGIDYTHPDLAGKVDLSRSVSFVPSDDALVASLFPGRHPVTDLHYHGTHVASTISSNAFYAAGVTSRTTLMGVKVLNRFGSGDFDALLNGVLWAADHDADVINMSIQAFGGKNASGRFIGYVNRVFNYAYRNGVVVVTIAGNQNRDLDHDGNNWQGLCTIPNVICVSATGPLSSAGPEGPWFDVDERAFYSNYGRSAVSVAAPGGTVPGLVWGSCSTTSLVVPVCRTEFRAVPAGGTSQAAPHVAALAALVIEDLGKNNPAQVRAAIERGADDLGPQGTDPVYGKGRINIPKTLGLQ